MDKRFLSLVLLIVILIPIVFVVLSHEKSIANQKPVVVIEYPLDGATVMNVVTIQGIAFDTDGDVRVVEIRIGDGGWLAVIGSAQWSYEWKVYDVAVGVYTISARAFDGELYSDVVSISLEVKKPGAGPSDVHKWAVFIAAANFPEKNESKLGNGGLVLAERMATYFIETYQYPASQVFILFDDGWIRADNGYGERIMTLQEREYVYGITYGAATKQTARDTLNHVIDASNQFTDSEVFIWIFSHGDGDETQPIAGGKLFSSSLIFLWDDVLSDNELGNLLQPIKSKKMCLIVDACYAGGFAEKTVFNLPTSLLLRSGIPKPGRIVIAGASKFRQGYASTTEGPLFSLLWFEGLVSGDADGFRAGFFGRGEPTRLRFLRDGKVSVEEAFYYARYILSTDPYLKEYKHMQPQMNDQYPRRGLFFLNRKEMIL